MHEGHMSICGNSGHRDDIVNAPWGGMKDKCGHWNERVGAPFRV